MNRRRKHNDPVAAVPSGRTMLEALAGFLAERWEQLQHQRQIALLQPGIDEIHDLRVSSRRLRAAIDHLEPFLGPEPVRRLRRPVRRLTRLLGELRNLDEARLYFHRLDLAGLESFFAALKQQRRKESAAVCSYLADMDCAKLERHVRATATALRAQDDGKEILALLAERNMLLYGRVHEQLTASLGADCENERHGLRIAIKKWRYFNELLACLLDRDLGNLLEQLGQYQALLGKINDIRVFGVLLGREDRISGDTRRKAMERLAHNHQKLLDDFNGLVAQQPLRYLFEV